jgi:DnaJ homolog subfamily C member 14
MQFLYDNHGPYLKIYFNENNMNNITSEYELFDRNNQHDISSFNNRDGLNNFLPNIQTQLPFHPMSLQQSAMPPKNPTIQSSVIHHLVSSLGPNKTGSYSPFGETIINNSMPPTPPCNVEPVLPEMVSSSPPQPINVAPATNVKKTRIVAEVKPMRMSYSDVVSKKVLNGQAPAAGSTNSASSSPNTTLPVSTKSVKVDKSKYSYDKKSSDGDKENQAKAKKSPINTSVIGNGSATDPRKLQSSSGKSDKTSSSAPSNAKKRTSQGSAKDSSASGIKTPLNQSGCSRSAKNKYASDSDGEDDDNSSALESDDDMEFYNVRKNVCHGDHHNIEKIITTKGSSSYKKVKSASSVGSTKKTEKIQKRTGKSTSRKRQKHEVLLKLCIAWGEYLLKFIQWLWILIYDVGYLSCGIIWDRMSWCYQCAAQGFETVRRELNGSPGKAAWLWMKNSWKRFDGKFEKKSRWAFWRWMFRKKQPTSEQVKDYYKDGRLPKTAEEAMKSLLNCKGKDAYRLVRCQS